VQSQLKAAEDARKQARNDSRDARSSVSRLAGSGTIDEQACIQHHSWQLWGVMPNACLPATPSSCVIETKCEYYSTSDECEMGPCVELSESCSTLITTAQP
jgi:hypothetical protein